MASFGRCWGVLDGHCSLSPVQQGLVFLARSFSQSSTLCARLKQPVFEGPLPPKRPGGVYAQFVRDFWKKNNITGIEVWKVCDDIAEAWSHLPETEKNVYYAKYQVEFQKYKKTMGDFIVDLGGKEEAETYFQNLNRFKRDLKKYKNYRRTRVKNDMTGYNLMISEMCADLPTEERMAFVMNSASKIWHSFDESKRQEYRDRAKEISKENKRKIMK